MTQTVETRSAPQDQPFWSRSVDFFRVELAPFPGRFEDSLRIAALAVLTVIISETFQIPLIAYSAYIVFFASKEDAASTLATGIVCTIAATGSVLLAEAAYVISAGEPAVRIPLMLSVMFGGMFLWRASPLGVVAFPTSFVLVMALTMGDFIDATETLTRTENLSRLVLWLWCVAMLPISLVVLGNLLTGRSPARSIRNELAPRIDTAGRMLVGGAGLPPHEPALPISLLRAGPARSMAALEMIGTFDKRSGSEKETWRRAIALVEHQSSLVIEWSALGISDPELTANATVLGEHLIALARAIDEDTALPRVPERPPLEIPTELNDDTRKAHLLLAQIASDADAIRAIRTSVAASAPAPAGSTPSVRRKFRVFLPDAFTNPDYCRYALKSTLAIFFTYASFNALSWPGIRTCTITAFFVALGSSGETSHKSMLRLSGALIGCGLGFGTVVFMMPYMTTITQLSLLIGVVSFVAAWISLSSERLSYVGLQIAMAFFFSTLVGYAPSIDHVEARDRVVGILFGITTVYVVFTFIWPVSALADVRNRLATALDRLSELVSIAGEMPDRARADANELLVGLTADLARARRVNYLEHFESGDARRTAPVIVNSALVDSVQGLLGPTVILATGSTPADTQMTDTRSVGTNMAHDAAAPLAEWLSQVARYLRSPKAAEPPPPALDIGSIERPIADAGLQSSAYAAWCRTLNRRVHDLDARLRQGRAP